jgi:endonuclease/exonuclease/phosphatase family metal-dependent hydrolase
MRLLNVATWNIYNGLPYGFSLVSDLKRINKIIDNIETEDLEVLALQELNNLSVLNCLKNRLEDKYNFFYFKKDLLLPNIFLFVFLFLSYYFVRDVVLLCLMFLFVNFILRNSTIYNFLMEDIKSGLVILVNKRINLDNYKLEYDTFNSQKGDYLNLVAKRGYLKLKIKLNKKSSLIIYNTHLNSTNKECESRKDQIKELYNDTKKNEKSDKIIILGDFNTYEYYKEIDILKTDFQDALENSDLKSWDLNNPFTNTLLSSKDNKLKKQGRIDYIFFKNLKKESSNVIFNSSNNICSDHYGIKSTFKLKKLK